MQVTVYNNVKKYKTISTKDLFDDCKHLLLPYIDKHIVSVEITDNYLTVMGEDIQIAKISINKNLKLSGVVRWFDEGAGFGMIRLKSGHSVKFYSCNVEGANQQYPELVTNIQLIEGAEVTAELSCDLDTHKALGLTKIVKTKKAA